jgi:predicted alpha/beta hydrolase family esterase
MQQVIVIHGGNTYDSYEDYLNALRERTLDVEQMKSKGWKSSLEYALGPAYEVIAPRMPLADNAKYSEWKIWFEKLLPYVTDHAVFIGHSLGGIFLAKYFAEEEYPKRMGAILLIAAPYESDSEYSLVDFVLPDDLSRLAAYGKRVHLYQSEDDFIVPFSNLERYKQMLPAAIPHVFTDRGHFLGDEFPELAEDIRQLQ